MIVDKIWKLTNVVRVRLAPRSSRSKRQSTFPDNVCSYSPPVTVCHTMRILATFCFSWIFFPFRNSCTAMVTNKKWNKITWSKRHIHFKQWLTGATALLRSSTSRTSPTKYPLRNPHSDQSLAFHEIYGCYIKLHLLQICILFETETREGSQSVLTPAGCCSHSGRGVWCGQRLYVYTHNYMYSQFVIVLARWVYWDLLLAGWDLFVWNFRFGGVFHAVPLFHTPCKESR